MPFDHDQIANLDAVIDGLDTPTSLETWQATDPYDAGMVAASAVRRALAGGGGASGATDEPFEFTEAVGTGPAFPIIAVNQGAGSFTVAGDQRAFFLPNGAGWVVSGSTGNDSGYDPPTEAPTYDAETDRTTIISSDGPLSSPVADGSVQAYPTYIAEYDMPANGAIEWVLVESDTPWSTTDNTPYVWAGTEDEPGAFINGMTANGLIESPTTIAQWPLLTLTSDPDAKTVTAASNAPPTRDGYTRFPAATKIRVVFQDGRIGGSDTPTGHSVVTVHHHFDSAATPVPIAT